MKIPAEFEDIFRGVELTEREALFLSWITSWDDYTIQNMRTVLEKVRSTLSKLQAENEKLRAEAEGMRSNWYKSVEGVKKLRAELEQVKRERDELERFLGELEGAVYTGQYFHLRPMIEKWRGQKED
mgnify:CR=1 FL=1